MKNSKNCFLLRQGNLSGREVTMAMNKIHINLPDEVHEPLKQMCDKECLNVSAQVQFLIKNAELKYNKEDEINVGPQHIGLTA